MVENQIIDGLVQYCQGIANEFRAKQDRISRLVKHNLTSGTARETILRDFLTEHSSGHYKVVQGFICDLDQVSRQCDIIIYNDSYPVIHSEGQIKVVWPKSVKMIVEVKTKLDKNSLYKAFENVKIAKTLHYTMTGLVFSFESVRAECIREHLKNYPSFEMIYAPNAILALGEKLIITSKNLWTPTTSNTAYEIWEARDESILMTFLSLMFLANIGGSSLETVAFNAISTLLSKDAKLLYDNIEIGK